MNVFRRLFGLSRREQELIWAEQREKMEAERAQAYQDIEDNKAYQKALDQGYLRFQEWISYKDSDTAKFWSKHTGIKDIDPIWIYDLGCLIMEYYPAKSKYCGDDLRDIANEEYKRLKANYGK